jgi:hypothetical protein
VKEVTLFPSAARALQQTYSSDIQDNIGHKGVIVTFAVSAVTSTPSLVLTIECYDYASGTWVVLLTATTVTTAVTTSYIVYPGVGALGEGVTETIGYPLPKTWRVSVKHENTNSATYSVGACMID